MKNRFCILTIALLLMGSLWSFTHAQATTEGKDFWVALTLATGPNGASNHVPYLAFSNKKPCRVTVTNPRTGWSIQLQLNQTDAWSELKTGAGAAQIPMSEWYDSQAATTVSGQVLNLGLHVTSTEPISLYAAQRMDNSFDVTNVLPTAVLQSEYMVQDFPPFDHQDNTSYANFAVLATEDNTVVNIVPKTTTYNNQPAGRAFQVTLNAGQVYHVLSQKEISLSGSTVTAEGGKRIAVFNGDVFTDVPGAKAARDCLYEQAIPVDYWGTQFVLSRSLERDCDRARITALEDGTTITINGQQLGVINSGETFEVELTKNAATNIKANSGYRDYPAQEKVEGDAFFLQTSCPCAVYQYMVSNGYKFSSDSDQPGSNGDPSMVWISPIEQKINKITFGICPTNKTGQHFINIVALTSSTDQVTLTGPNGSMFTAEDTWQPVPGNAQYSYMRKKLAITSTDNVPTNSPSYTLSSPTGVIAHVYGNGNNESYAYSVGSTAVKRGLQIGDATLVDNTQAEGTYCIGEIIRMNAQVGSDIIDAANWDMGDGVTYTDGRIMFDYSYDTPGWYDITANVRAHKACSNIGYPEEAVHVRIRVVRPDTVLTRKKVCSNELPFVYGNKTFTQATEDTVHFGCDSVVVLHLVVGEPSTFSFDTVARDEFKWNGQTYEKSGTYTWTGTNAQECDSTVTARVTVITCLKMTLSDTEHAICPEDGFFLIGCNIEKGEIADAWLNLNGEKYAVDYSSQTNLRVSISDIPAGLYPGGQLFVVDKHCGDTLQFPVNLTVYYSQSVFAQKWQNVLAVYNHDYNGGYDFIGFQWVKNGVPVEGATSSIYHQEEDLTPGDKWQVILTRSDGVTLISCEKTIVESAVKNAPAMGATKSIENNTIYVIRDGVHYNMLGVPQRK